MMFVKKNEQLVKMKDQNAKFKGKTLRNVCEQSNEGSGQGVEGLPMDGLGDGEKIQKGRISGSDRDIIGAWTGVHI